MKLLAAEQKQLTENEEQRTKSFQFPHSKFEARRLSLQAWVESSVSRLSMGGSSKAITIDDIASRPSHSKKPAVLTSPRSIKVCLEHGIDPAMLVPKAVSDFAQPVGQRAPGAVRASRNQHSTHSLKAPGFKP